MKMSRTIATLALCLPLAAEAEGTALGVKVGTLGYGLELDRSLSEKTTFRFGLNGYDKKYSETDSGIDYNYKLQWRSAAFLFDWHPWAGTFHTSYGLLYNGNKIKATAKGGSGTVTIGDTTYAAGTDLTGEISFNKAAPYLGLGWGNPVAPNKRFGFTTDLGVVYQGSPKVKLKSNSSLVSQSDLDTEARQLEQDLKDYKYYPLIAFAFSYQF